MNATQTSALQSNFRANIGSSFIPSSAQRQPSHSVLFGHNHQTHALGPQAKREILLVATAIATSMLVFRGLPRLLQMLW